MSTQVQTEAAEEILSWPRAAWIFLTRGGEYGIFLAGVAAFFNVLARVGISATLGVADAAVVDDVISVPLTIVWIVYGIFCLVRINKIRHTGRWK